MTITRYDNSYKKQSSKGLFSRVFQLNSWKGSNTALFYIFYFFSCQPFDSLFSTNVLELKNWFLLESSNFLIFLKFQSRS